MLAVELIVVVLLTLLNGLLAMSELAVVSARPVRLRQLIERDVVGSRRALALRDRERRMYVGPDNGLLLPAAGRAGIDEAHEILNPEYALEPVSRTFHGRDIFAPAAAHLAKGVELGELGPPIDPAALVQLELPTANLGRNRIEATVLYVDNFGNIQLNLTREHLDQLAIEPGARVELELDGRRYYATAARTFSDARRGDLILYEDSYRNIAVAMNRGDAGEMLSARPGQSLRINLDAP